MLAIDTNAFVRIFMEDNAIQTRKARHFIEHHHPVFVSTIVFCESIWLFKSHFGLTKAKIITLIEKILKTKQFSFEHHDVLWRAFYEYQRCSADLTDCIISALAQTHDCSAVMTFDKNAAKSKGFRLIH